MDSEIQLISDGDGLAVIGNPTDVEAFLTSEGLTSTAFELPKLRTGLATGAATAQAGSEVAANAGRWVKLTEQSAQTVKKLGLRESSKSGLATGVFKGEKGQIAGFVEFAKGPGSMLTNPAMLAGAAGIMAQVAMQQTMDEITDYLETIEEKVDDVLRAQTDAVVARMVGVGFVLEEAMTLREHRGRVDDVTWSKVQSTPGIIAETQAYALRRLDALAEKTESKARMGDLAKAARVAQDKAQEWLAVLARCFQLQDAIAVLELDRVLDASPDELDGHRLGLKHAREARLELISRSTVRLVTRLEAAANVANAKVLLHPSTSPEVVESSNDVTSKVVEFHGRLGITEDRESLQTRRWSRAALDVRDKAVRAGADRVDASRRLGSETFDRTRSATGKISTRISERTLRRRGDRPESE